jgi:hypothetical protein
MTKLRVSIWGIIALLAIFAVSSLVFFTGCGNTTSSSSSGGTGSGSGAGATIPQVTGVSNLSAPGSPIRSGDWIAISGTAFGGTRASTTPVANVSFTNGISSVYADLYNSWTDTQIVCRVPDGMPVANVGVVVVTGTQSSSNNYAIVTSPTPNPNPQPTPPNQSPSPSPTPTVSPTIGPVTGNWVLQGYAVGAHAGNQLNGGVIMADVIVLDNGTYRMYYGFTPTTGAVASMIRYAESTDAVQWTVKGTCLEGSTNPQDREYLIGGPSVVRLPDGRYRMYYQACPQFTPGQDTPAYHVRSAISNDGIAFTREGVRIEINAFDPTSPLSLAGHGTYFIAANGTYVGIFSGNAVGETGPSSLFMATSSDGLTFTGFTKKYESWHDPVVVKTDRGYQIFATYLLEKQGTALSTDGISWPQSLTEIKLVDSTGRHMTEASDNVGDIGGVVLPTNAIRLFTNALGGIDIVYFDRL